tara:strand:- start:881 stop:1666 length:786 start_codon:yes stop_codon:yes gene_type:complete
MALTGKSPSGTYKDLLTIENSNNGVDSTLRSVNTGNGSSTSTSISDRALKVKSATDNTTALDIQNSSGSTKFVVDTTNNQVKALGNHVNTQYAYFGIESGENANYLANVHYAIPFNMAAYPNVLYTLDIGTGTDPDTSFTTANTNTQRASTLQTCMWYVPDAISIDGVYSTEGADTATGDTTRMHLMSYTFNSGSTSALADGTLLAHNSDVTNAGSEQVYLSTWTVDSATVTAGKVILATFRSDSVNSDYSIGITVKYHLT